MCILRLEKGEICGKIEDLEHVFSQCPNVQEIYSGMKCILESFLDRKINFNELIHFSFNHRNKKKLAVALWLEIKIMFMIFQDKCRNKAQILKLALKELDWNLKMNKRRGSNCEMVLLKKKIESELER